MLVSSTMLSDSLKPDYRRELKKSKIIFKKSREKIIKAQ